MSSDEEDDTQEEQKQGAAGQVKREKIKKPKTAGTKPKGKTVKTDSHLAVEILHPYTSVF